MSRCRECQYSQIDHRQINDKTVEIACCSITRQMVKPDIDADCKCFNLDLSNYDICYNCKYYVGGGDWGLFCSHKDKYHHLGKFTDEPCSEYVKVTKSE
jgi:hypothetical protein